MASSPSEQASESTLSGNSAELFQAKVPLSNILLMAVVVAGIVLLVATGAFYFVLRSGKFATRQIFSEPTSASAGSTITHAVVLEPLVANLADPGGRAYLRLVATLRVADPIAGVGAKSDTKAEKAMSEGPDDLAAIRDTMLGVLGSATADSLLEPGGKERLKSQLLLALSVHVPATKIKQIYFTEFLVQR